MFGIDDYPDWVDEMYNEFTKGHGYSMAHDVEWDKHLWDSVKESEEPPHLGNASVSIMFSDVIDGLVSKFELSDEDRCKFTTSINAQVCSISFNDIEFDDIKTAEEAIHNYLRLTKQGIPDFVDSVVRELLNGQDEDYDYTAYLKAPEDESLYAYCVEEGYYVLCNFDDYAYQMDGSNIEQRNNFIDADFVYYDTIATEELEQECIAQSDEHDWMDAYTDEERKYQIVERYFLTKRDFDHS